MRALKKAFLAITAGIITLLIVFIQIHPIKTESDLDKFYTVLENRNGEIIIEISNSRVLNTETGEGETEVDNYYIHHSENKYKNGDRITSIFVYNPLTNATDDILWRFDIKTESDSEYAKYLELESVEHIYE